MRKILVALGGNAILKKGEKGILDRYQLMDDIWRTFSWLAERKRYKAIA